MNTRRKLQVFLASALGGAILLLALWLLSSTVLQPVVAHEIEGATLQTLPPPFLNYDDVADAPFDNPPSPVVDGLIAPGEYAGAGKVTFPGYGGDVEVFFKEDGAFLYVAFELPDKVNHMPVPDVSIYLDTNNSGGSVPQTDDFRFQVWRNGGVAEWQGNGAGWSPHTPITWTYGFVETMSGWSVEFGIPFTKLSINPGIFKELGLALNNGGLGSTYYWPAGADGANPDTWGSLVSSSDWDIFYWKPGPWEDYAPSGMPDFDQNQPGWLAYDGPAAAANSLWWFDSKFEALTGTMPPVISDTYRLVRSYGPWDDHHYSNTVPLISDLARNYFGTNQGITGTDPISMFHGIHNYLRDKGLWDDYIVTLVDHPDFKWVADEVMRSEDVILLLGFYEWRELEGRWARVAGHYVNVAGVDPVIQQIAFSDPAMDNAEQGWPGRVLSGTLILPHQPGHASYVHNDAGNVSHDVYPITTTNSPGGTWGPAEYPWWMAIEMGLIGANPNPLIDMEEYGGGDLQVEVEVALAVSPYTWKASGEWLPEGDDPIWGVWQPWQDYAPNGMPDFDQKQDNWQSMFTSQWTFCGPVAAANSLWWFDSKFEPNPISPPAYNDNYPMVWPYGPWDDHDPLNVDDPATPWPPGGEFVEDLATYFHTDMLGSGTVITDLYHGIEQYITDHGLRQGYVITQVKSPDFWWVAEEVEVSEDVILLLGFWQNQNPGPGDPHWVRLGGHYVTLPGVDKKGGLVAFSDPYYDGAEYVWPYAYPNGWPTVMGRVADGWLIPHPPYHSHLSTVHNDAGNVSHDVYYVAPTDSPGGVWGPEGYVEDWGNIENFWGQNGQEDAPSVTSDPIQTEVDWAVAVSPVADVYVRKEITPPVALPGDWVTFTINFGNDGSLPAENVVITDTLPAELTNLTWSYWTSNGLTVTARAGTTYVWNLPNLAWQEWGTITITAQVGPTASGVITNTAEIATSSVEQYQIPALPNSASASFTVQTADVSITKSVQPASVVPGDWVTYTLTYANSGSAAAASVVITDILPTELLTSTANYVIWTSYVSSGPIIVTDHYIWSMGTVPAGGRGIITITAQVDPNLIAAGSINNQADISTTTPESDYTNNSASASQILCIPPSGATFVYTPPAPLTGQTVTFTGSVILGDPAPAYTWDFDDGTGSGNPVTHIYNNAGDYTVWMTATNSCGQAVYSDTLSVCEPVDNVAIQYAPPDPGVGQTINFTATATGSSPLTYVWAADDGWTDTGATASHAFATLGNHTVWLTATNSCGQDYASTIILVRGYGVDLLPASATATGKPGGTITYTLTLSNTGNMSDTYTIAGSVSGKPWTTNWPPTVGPVAGGGIAQVDVTVQISSTASDGDQSYVVITAASQGDPTKSDTSVLTTTATTQPVQRDVTIAPHTDAQTGDVGTTVAYTLRVTNTGTITDYFNLSIGGPTWSTTLSVYGLNLKPGEGQPVTVYVQVPAGATNGAQDAATITARSAVVPTVADSATLTTTAYVPTYGVDMTPLVAQQTGHPGDVMTYTLTVRNTGERTDTYTLSKAGDVWTTTLSAPSVGPLAPNGTAQFDVMVQIPGGAISGTFDMVQVTAASQKDNSKSDTAVLTTTAIAASYPLTRGVRLAAAATAQEGDIGTWITYTLRITNTGNVADFFNLTWQGNIWPVDLSAYGLSLAAGQGTDVLAYVWVPLTVSGGDTDSVVVKATSSNDTTAADAVVLTTTARRRHIYLPLVLRNYTP